MWNKLPNEEKWIVKSLLFGLSIGLLVHFRLYGAAVGFAAYVWAVNQ